MANPSSSSRRATLLLLLACVFWGCSFTWARAIGKTANDQLDLPTGSIAGPMMMLGFRFTGGAILWLALVPAARRGWSLPSLGRGSIIGLSLAAGMVLQMLALDRSTAPVTAFLTGLTVLFVPLISLLRFFRTPAPSLWVGVGLAIAGVWLMTGASPTGFGTGELLGLACSLAFAIYMLTVNALVPRDNAARLAPVTFAVVGFIALAIAAVTAHRIDPSIVLRPDVWPRLLLLIVLPTVGAFGILTKYQPMVDPTRAALLYLFEPIFSALYDYAETRHALPPIALAGAGLVIAANLLVELMPKKAKP